VVKITVFPASPHLLAIQDQVQYMTRAELALLEPLIEAWPRSVTLGALITAADVAPSNIHWHLHRLRRRLTDIAPGIRWVYPPVEGQYVLCSDAVEIAESA